MKKLILASVALIAVFASCKKEDIRTVYKAEPAKATITVEVFDALSGQNVTSQATINASVGTVTGNKIEIIGDQGHYYAIPAQQVTINAVYSGRDGSKTIQIDGVLEDSEASYSTTVIVGSAIDPTKPVNYNHKDVKSDDPVLVESRFLEKATHTADGKKWCVNNTEFFLYGLTDYEEKTGNDENMSFYKLVDGVEISDSEKIIVEEKFQQLLAVDPLTITKKEKDYTVSAFSYFWCQVDYKVIVNHVDIVRVLTLEDGKTVETVLANAEIHTWGSGFEKGEKASPDHASHYVEGHGVVDSHYSHGHGYGGYNAGGGIVAAD